MIRLDERQIVLTYCGEDGMPQGLITGQQTRENAFYVRHVVVFGDAPAGTLSRMLHAGIAEAWELHYAAIVFGVPRGWHRSVRLERLGRRLGFTQYADEGGMTWHVLHKS